MGKIIIISGLPGVGKSSVLNTAFSKVSSSLSNLKVKIINYGDAMLETALSLGWVKHRDEMRKLSIDKQISLQREAAFKIKKEAENCDLLIIDTHMFINTPEGRWPGISMNNLDLIKPSAFILIEATPEEIIQRRSKDKSRIRELYDVEEIKDELIYNRIIAGILSVLTGMPVSIIMNKEGKLEEAADRLAKVLTEASLR